MVTIYDLPALIGSDASTGRDTIYAGKLFNSIERYPVLFFHELGHMPQWASGELTHLGYIGSALKAAAAYGHGLVTDIHDNIPVEIAADEFSERMVEAHNKAGKPCR